MDAEWVRYLIARHAGKIDVRFVPADGSDGSPGWRAKGEPVGALAEAVSAAYNSREVQRAPILLHFQRRIAKNQSRLIH
jgi:hypothetical protein